MRARNCGIAGQVESVDAIRCGVDTGSIMLKQINTLTFLQFYISSLHQ